MDPAQVALYNLLIAFNTCELSMPQANSLLMEGFRSLELFSTMRCNKDLADVAKRSSSIPEDRGGARIGQLHVRRLEALLLWCFDRNCRNLTLLGELFTPDVMNQYLTRINLQEEEAEKDETVKPPQKLNTTTLQGWKHYDLSMMNYLWSIKGAT
jgi:hypothetical protein